MIPTASLRWKWHRLRAMSAPEIRDRIRERFFLPDDLNIPAELADWNPGPAHPLPGFLPDPDAAPPRIREHIAARATEIRKGSWILFEHLSVQTSLPPNWHRDPISDRSAPKETPSRKLDHRTCPNGCDPRVVWEISRLIQPVILAQDMFLNSSEESAGLVLTLLEDWHRNNPVGRGLNWTSTLEAGLRLINLTWIDLLLESRLPPEQAARWNRLVQQLIPGHVLFVNRHFSPGSSANNHLLGELAGLALAAARWPAVGTLGQTAPELTRRLQNEVLRQFANDGGNREQALHYHLFAWELIWHALRLHDLPGPVRERLAAAAAYYATLTPETAPAWDFGDGDDAVVTPLCLNPSATAPEWKHWFLNTPKAEGLLYWLGPCPFTVKTPAVPSTAVFPDSGMAVLRRPDGWARLDASPLGLPPMCAHGHLDTLHVSLWFQDIPVLIDPGTGAYYADPALRDRLADAPAHNGPCPVPQPESPKRMGPFLWSGTLPPAKLEHSPDTITAHAAAGRRTVHFSNNAWHIEDSLPENGTARLHFILAPEWTPLKTDSTSMSFTHPQGVRLHIRIEAEPGVTPEYNTLSVSPRFRQQQESHAITFVAREKVRTILQLTREAEPS